MKYSFSSVLLSLLLIYSAKVQLSNAEPVKTTTISNDTQPSQEVSIRNQKSKEMQKYINQTIDPCQDFYAYACGQWLRHHNTSRDLLIGTTPMTQLQAKINTDLHSILKEQITVQDTTIERQIKFFYKSCLSTEKYGLQQQEFLSKFITDNGGFPAVPGSNWLTRNPHYNWQQVVAGLRYKYGMDILIGLDIDINYENMEENSIYLTEPSTLIPRKLCSKSGVQQIDIRDYDYDLIEKDVAENLKNWLTIKLSDARRYAADIVTFEYDLCSSMRDKNDDSASSQTLFPKYERHALSEYTYQLNGSIDFARFVTLSYGTPVYKPAFMAAPDYYRQLIRIIADYNLATVANYIMYRALEILNFPLKDTPGKRPGYCLALIKQHFPKVLGIMYQEERNHEHTKSDVNSIYKMLKDAFRISLRSLWLEESTSRLARAKLDTLELSYPNNESVELFNFKLNETDYWKNLKNVMGLQSRYNLGRIYENGLPKPKRQIESYDTELVFSQIQQRINLGWGLMQEPFYKEQYPASMRFASIGQALAKTLAHAFDDLHWSADFRNLSNWDRQTASEYKQRSECFREQLSNYLYNNPMQFQQKAMVRELVAASSGLNVAFEAYLKWLALLDPYNNANELLKETLPQLNYSNTQLFFLSFAQLQCRALKPAVNISSLTASPLLQHRLEFYLVNGPLRNSVEFAREFNCAIGSEMNPADKCFVY